jgi:hypothetical protein
MKIISINIGKNVFCDICNKDYGDSDKVGGFLFQSKAVCPDCEFQMLQADANRLRGK